jgi:hypothetical protein
MHVTQRLCERKFVKSRAPTVSTLERYFTLAYVASLYSQRCVIAVIAAYGVPLNTVFFVVSTDVLQKRYVMSSTYIASR